MAIPISSSVASVNPAELFYTGYELGLDAIVPSSNLTSSFNPSLDNCEFYIYTKGKTILYSNPNFENYTVPDQTQLSHHDSQGMDVSPIVPPIYAINVDPVNDVYYQGYSTGDYFALYNFLRYEVGSKQPYFLSEISSDRTELRLKNNFIQNSEISSEFSLWQSSISDADYKDEYYLNFGQNQLFIAINTQLELAENGEASILIKLYKPLPSNFSELDTCSIVTKVGETVAYEVKFTQDIGTVDILNYISGPNTNLDIKDRINNSTEFKSYGDLIQTKTSSSKYLLDQIKSSRGVQINPNYADWHNFIHFSSAEQRLRNFYLKVQNIETYKAELSSLDTITGAVTGSTQYSQSKATQEKNIIDTIKTFDGYDYYLYYLTGSNSWPKQTSTYPYELYSYSSSVVQNWFGTTDESGAYFSSGKNILNSASLYDNNNKDYLKHLIPPFINSNTSNDPYFKFINMVGQSFDEIWLYTEALNNIRNNTNALTGSVLPLEMADEALESMGWDTYGNSFNSQLFDESNIGVLPPTGSGEELITNYVNITSGSVVNYYNKDFTTLGYIVQLLDPGSPYPVNNHGQEIYKRIFNNMVSLVKRKGTITGLRQLINIWGVPATMLRISEFGGKNKDDENDYDLWQDRYSTAFTSYAVKNTASVSNPSSTGRRPQPSACISVPWQCLTSNFLDSGEASPADCIQFRFKTATPVDIKTNFSESLLFKQGQPQPPSTPGLGWGEFGISLHQSSSASGSASGSVPTNYNTYASMSFVISGSVAQGASGIGYFKTPPIYLPFYNGDWWSVQIQRKTHISQSGENGTTQEFELRVGQCGYDGNDGNKIKYKASSSIITVDNTTSSINEAWNLMASVGTGLGDYAYMNKIDESRIYLPGSISIFSGMGGAWNRIGPPGTTANDIAYDLGDPLSGSFQELRYYRRALSASAFNDYVMNPESIQGLKDRFTGSYSSYDLLSFRAPLGNELEYTNPEQTASFYNPGTGYNIKMYYFGRLNPYHPLGSTYEYNNQGLGSVHPSIVNMKGSLYTSSFYNKNESDPILVAEATGSTYEMWIRSKSSYAASQSLSGSYLEPINDIVYLDQPSAGLKNRITNKIQVKDKNEYGYVLSRQRSIQQSPQQSQSYNENINNLEVGFSFQNEINDDIIAAYGHGVVSSVVGDPRFVSESGDRYPGLTRIADEYFKKYQGDSQYNPTYTSRPKRIEDELDYNRLIKFYETSLFKAIKNYIPARTSLSTGIIIKQHLLERNRVRLPNLTPDSTIAMTPETGSFNNMTQSAYGGEVQQANQTGFSSPMVFRNLEITGSVDEFENNPDVVKVKGSSGNDTRLNSLYTSSRSNELPWYSAVGNEIQIPNQYGNETVTTAGNILPGINSSVAVGSILGYETDFPLTPVYFYGQEYADTPSTPTTAMGEWRQLYNAPISTGGWNTWLAKNVNPYVLEDRYEVGGVEYSSESQNSGSIMPQYSTITGFRFAFVFDNDMAAASNQRIDIQIRSNKRGVIQTYVSTYSTPGADYSRHSYETPEIEIYAGELLTFWVKISDQNWQIQNHRVEFGGKYIHRNGSGTSTSGFPDSNGPDTWIPYNPASQSLDLINNDPNHNMPQQGWFSSVETKYGLVTGSFINYNNEFYDGEYSGSNLQYYPSDWIGGRRYNPYRVYADGNEKNADQTWYSQSIGHPTTDLSAGPYTAARFPTVGTNNADFKWIRATGSLVFPSGSSGNVADQLMFRTTGPTADHTKAIKIKSTDGTTRYYVSVGFLAPNSMYQSAAQGKYLFMTTAGALYDYTSKSTAGVVPANGTYSTTLTAASGKTITADVTIAGGVLNDATVTDPNPGTDNGSVWAEVGDVFNGNPGGGGFTVNFELTANSVTNGLLAVQCPHPANSLGGASSLSSSLVSDNGHGDKLNTLTYYNQGQAGNMYSLQIKESYSGVTGAPAISSINSYADNAAGIVMLTDAPGTYAFPSKFQGGVDELATSTWYLENAITNLVPGITYNISFKINDYLNDSSQTKSPSNYDVGLSTLLSPGGSTNGIPNTLRRNNSDLTDDVISGSWTQQNGTTAMFFAAFGLSGSITEVNVSIPDDILAKKHLLPRDTYKIMPTQSIIFDNSQYNPINNNVSGSRTNKFYQDVDYATSQYLPINIDSLRAGTALESTVPESYYTTTKIINPRYNGVRLSSFDYNFYNIAGETGNPALTMSLTKAGSWINNTPSVLAPHFLNGDTGSWTGDVSYGNTAVIDKNPIYIAHFKTSETEPQLYETRTFTIDSLIRIPSSPINKTVMMKDGIEIEQSEYISPVTIQVNGSNDQLMEVAGNFERGRKASWQFLQPSKGGKDYEILSVGQFVIKETSNEYQFIGGNEVTADEYANTMSFHPSKLLGKGLAPPLVTFGASYDLSAITGSPYYSGSNFYVPYPQNGAYVGGTSGRGMPLMRTGSGCLLLKGQKGQLNYGTKDNSSPESIQYAWYGPKLAMLHALNHFTKKNQATNWGSGVSPTKVRLSWPYDMTWNPADEKNYFRLNYSASHIAGEEDKNMNVYEDYKMPFLIERGDIIRVKYAGTASRFQGVDDIQTRDFTVMHVTSSRASDVDGIEGEFFTGSFGFGGTPGAPMKFPNVNSGYTMDRICVEPDPSTLSVQILSGSINSFTLIRRIDNDTKIYMKVAENETFYSSSLFKEDKTSPSGYLIPNDMSSVQKQNALTIINQLNEKNAYTSDNTQDKNLKS